MTTEKLVNELKSLFDLPLKLGPKDGRTKTSRKEVPSLDNSKPSIATWQKEQFNMEKMLIYISCDYDVEPETYSECAAALGFDYDKMPWGERVSIYDEWLESGLVPVHLHGTYRDYGSRYFNKFLKKHNLEMEWLEPWAVALYRKTEE